MISNGLLLAEYEEEMLNEKTNYVSSEEISLEQLIEDIEMLVLTGVKGFKITENFPVNGERSYVVDDLFIECCQDGVVVCNDSKNIILSNFYVLSMFLIDRIKTICRTTTENEQYGEIDLGNGNIMLKVIYT